MDQEMSDAMKTLEIGGREYERLADGEYDAVVLGTGLTECVLSGILSVAGMKVLHADRNDYYGAACASLQLNQMVEKFRPDSAGLDPQCGASREYNIDLVPKFIMSGGNMVRVLLHTDVTKYLDFKLVDGSFVFTGDRPHKVPATPREAMTSGLMGLLEKNRCRSFFSFIHSYVHGDPQTYGNLDLTSMTMDDLYKHYNLGPDTIGFVGHALALYRDEEYRSKPALETVQKIQLYANSLARYGKSPYLYPMYGLGELPQAFARLSAVHGGTFMLHTPIHEVLYGADGKCQGVRSGNCVARTKLIVGDPSYFPEKARKVRQVVRCYCILSERPPNVRESDSCQIIIPAKQVSESRKNDIYVLVLSEPHRVCPAGKFIALVSTTLEGSDPEKELEMGIRLLGDGVLERFLAVDDVFEPASDGTDDQVFVTRSYDAATHFETTVDDILDVYRRIFKKELILGDPFRAGEKSS